MALPLPPLFTEPVEAGPLIKMGHLLLPSAFFVLRADI